MKPRNIIAIKHGFQTVEELMAASRALERYEDDRYQSYVARSPNGYWFVWDDTPDDFLPVWQS